MGSFLRLIDLCVSLSLRIKDLLGPVMRVKKKQTEGRTSPPRG